MNSGEYCLDDYVELEGSIEITGKDFDNEKFEGIPHAMVKVLQDFIQTYMQLRQKEKGKGYSMLTSENV